MRIYLIIYLSKAGQIPDIYDSDLSPGLLSGISRGLHQACAAPPVEQSLAAFPHLRREMVQGRKMHVQPPEIARKARIAHGMCSVFQKITVPRAPGLSYSWRREELHRPRARVSSSIRAGAGPEDGAVLCDSCCK